MKNEVPILVVGSGLAGLFIAHNLSQKGYDVVLVEKASSIGGLMRTLRYIDHRGDLYLSDIGPHIPPRSEIWNNLCKDVEVRSIQAGSLRSSVMLRNLTVSYPLSLSQLTKIPTSSLLRYVLYYFKSSMFRRREVSVEDALINKFGESFYEDYLNAYILKFWKMSPHLISKDFDLRIPSPPSFKHILRNFILDYVYGGSKVNNPTAILYPKYGVGEVPKNLFGKSKSVEFKLNATIKNVEPSSSGVHVKIKDTSMTKDYFFEKVIWTGSLRDLLTLLNLPHQKKIAYRDLLVVNFAIEEDNLLGEGIIDSYIMHPNTIFHRIYEPKKFSSNMAPQSLTSTCVEITLNKTMKSNVPVLIKESFKQLRQMFNLSESKVKLLGSEIVENAYPTLYIDYKLITDELSSYLEKKNIYLVGRTGSYRYQGIDSVLKDSEKIITKLSTC